MVETRSGRKFALLCLAAAFLMLFVGRWLSPVNDVVLSIAAPFEGAVSGIATGIGDGVSGVFEGPRLRGENLTLKQQNAILVRRLITLQIQAHENQLFRSMVHYSGENLQLHLLAARVIADDPNSLAPYILINKGARDHVRNGMTVLDQNGYFLGSVSATVSNQARVQLLLSPSSSVGAFDIRTRAHGLVEGQFGARPELHWVVASDTVQRGDLIVTSGQMNLFPRGVLLGQVASVTHRNEDIFQKAVVQPAADFQNLEIVQVVRNFKPDAPTKLLIHP